MLAGVLACTVESISYYPTVAQMCKAPPPPLSAINRGIGIEGLGTILAGLFGSGNGTNTFGENVGAIGVTKVIHIFMMSLIFNLSHSFSPFNSFNPIRFDFRLAADVSSNGLH